MAIGDLPLMNVLKTKMQWHQVRQRVLSENVANADTPHYRGKDLAKVDFQPHSVVPPSAPRVGMVQTSAGHLAGRAPSDDPSFKKNGGPNFQVRPNGNQVNLEEEMTKSAENQIDYQTATSLYQQSLSVLRTALGRKA
jgi:flagellar basal-body rod protein FlgB